LILRERLAATGFAAKDSLEFAGWEFDGKPSVVLFPDASPVFKQGRFGDGPGKPGFSLETEYP
jgi:hypothetical protein